MARRKASADQPELIPGELASAPCVPAIRAGVSQWREDGYPGVTGTTRLLLNYWFHTDHRLRNGERFEYYPFQREAMETLVYLYEYVRARRQKDLLQKFAPGSVASRIRLLQYDQFARYCVKMATGSGKTKVMALAVAWHYFNAVSEARDDFCKTFLLLAPNVIVFERLCKDFAGGRVFRADPVIPPELGVFWDFQVYLRGEGERAGSLGALYLANVQQLYERPEGDDGETDEMTGVLGPRPPANPQAVEEFHARLVKRGGPLVVINDEAHHTHDEASEWNKVTRRLHAEVPGEVAAQLDFTATPRHSKGALFSWTVYDYPLKQAIQDNVVKAPIKGVTRQITEQPSKIASTRYQAYLTAGVERWREYREQLAPLGKKPVLFIMMNDTADADDVGDWLKRKYPEEFGGERLEIIHVNRSGDVANRDLDKARAAVREVDEPDSPINCIVSVLMLREGWDVRNVTVIVGLRPYTSKANILPEQTIGRGLRLMFRRGAVPHRERTDVIGNKAFLQFIEDLERQEGIELEEFEVGKDKLQILTIMPDPAKMDKDIALPVLSPVLSRKKSLAAEIAALDVMAFACPRLPRKPGDATAQSFHYEGYDILTLEKLVERDYTIPEPQTAQEVIGYYARRIAQDVRLPSQFAVLAPKVRQFLEHRAFGERVDLSDPAMVRAIGNNVAQYVTVKVFVQALREVVVEQLEPELVQDARRLSETPPFPYSRATVNASKCVFNLVPCANELERRFAQFLEAAPDVNAFSKLPEQFGFAIEYTDGVGNLRYYEPDFVAVLPEGAHYLLETKGAETTEVAYKDRAARLWCENASALTGTPWEYLKVPQKDFEQLQPADFADLIALGMLPLPGLA